MRDLFLLVFLPPIVTAILFGIACIFSRRSRRTNAGSGWNNGLMNPASPNSILNPANPANPASPLNPANPTNPASPLNTTMRGNP